MLSDSDRGEADSPATAAKPKPLGGGDDVDSGDSLANKPKKDKGKKPPKGDRKKDKPWKTGAAGAEGGNSEATDNGGAENGLKLNVNPTERLGQEEGAKQAEEGSEAEGQAAADNEGAEDQTRVDLDGEENGDGPREDGERQDEEEDEADRQARKRAEAVAAAEAAARAQEEAERAKRAMERMLLTKEVRAMKDKLLDYVNDIIVRQNGQDPVSNFESFINETAARKVLKELLGEFSTGVEDVRTRCVANDEKLKNHKVSLEKHDGLIKKVQAKAEAVDKFNKRLTDCEQKLETMRDLQEKRHETTKDFVQRTKEMLEARVDQITQYNARLEGMHDEISKLKDLTGSYKDNITKEMNKANDNVARLEGTLNEFMDQ